MLMKQKVTLYTLRNPHGLRATITNLGGRVVSLFVPDRNGILRDVVLGFENVEDYLPENHRSDFGAAIGRYANRLNNGQITIDGKTYQLPQNDGKNCLHGGPDGWQYRIFNPTFTPKKFFHRNSGLFTRVRFCKSLIFNICLVSRRNICVL